MCSKTELLIEKGDNSKVGLLSRMSKFKFNDEQFIEIREIWRDINSQCEVFQQRSGCPNNEIIKMIDSAKSYWENKQEREDMYKDEINQCNA